MVLPTLTISQVSSIIKAEKQLPFFASQKKKKTCTFHGTIMTPHPPPPKKKAENVWYLHMCNYKHVCGVCRVGMGALAARKKKWISKYSKPSQQTMQCSLSCIQYYAHTPKCQRYFLKRKTFVNFYQITQCGEMQHFAVILFFFLSSSSSFFFFFTE